MRPRNLRFLLPSQDSSSLVDPATVSVIGVVGKQGAVQSPSTNNSPEKKPKKDKATTSKDKKSVESKSAMDSRIEEVDHKYSDRFNRLEALLISKSFQPTFSSSVKVTPSLSLPANVAKGTENFFQPTSSEGTGKHFSGVKHQLTSQLGSDRHLPSSKRTGKDFSAVKNQSTSQLQSDRHQPGSSPSECTGTDFSAAKHQSTSQLRSDRHCQWQCELRLLKEDQPDLSMRQSGPFLQSGESLTRWTSVHPL